MKFDKYVVKGVVCDEIVIGNDIFEFVFLMYFVNLGM